MSARRPVPFLSFEGIEGCGKTTQIERLASRLRTDGRACLVTREPGGTPFGDQLRDLLLRWEGSEIDGLIELFLLEASRRAHVARAILPALAAGTIVISDRFADSSIAYQAGGRGIDREWVEHMNRYATGGVEPDLTFLLDLDAEEGLRRVQQRDRTEDRLEREKLDFHRRVRESYLALAAGNRERFRVIDATMDAARIHEKILAWVVPLLPSL